MRRCHKHVGGGERKNPGEKEFENNRGSRLLDEVIWRRKAKISNMLASVGLLDLWVPCFVSLASAIWPKKSQELDVSNCQDVGVVDG